MACGGGSGSSDPVTGFLSKGPVTGASCEAFSVSGGAKGTSLGEIKSTAAGSVNFGSLNYTGTALIECSGGSYTDEATGTTITPAPAMNAVVNMAPGGNYVISPLTQLAYSMAGSNLQDAIDTHNADVADQFGLDGVDITSQVPTDLNTTAAGNDAAGKYGLVLAAISQMDATDTGKDIAGIMTDLQTDMADGTLTTADFTKAVNDFVNGTSDAAGNGVAAVVDLNDAVGTGDPADVAVTGVSVALGTGASSSVANSATTQLQATIAPANATNPLVTWSSSNTALATVDSDGKVTAAASGTGNVTITATTADGSFTNTLDVTVTGGVANTAPTANAGADQNVSATANPVTLDGSASSDSDGTVASYAWTQTAGTTVALSDATAAQPTFDASVANDAGETLTFSLVVTDDDSAASTADTVDIIVAAVADVTAPAITTHPAITITTAESVHNNGTGLDSLVSDTVTADADIEWRIANMAAIDAAVGANVVTIAMDSDSGTFKKGSNAARSGNNNEVHVHPGAGTGTVTVELEARDEAGNVGTASFTLTINSATVTLTPSSANIPSAADNTLVFTVDGAITGTLDASDFTIAVTGSPQPTVSNATVSGAGSDTVTLTLNRDIVNNNSGGPSDTEEVVTFTFTKSASTANLNNIASTSVVNNSDAGTCAECVLDSAGCPF
jgi:hypothetical protein